MRHLYLLVALKMLTIVVSNATDVDSLPPIHAEAIKVLRGIQSQELEEAAKEKRAELDYREQLERERAQSKISADQLIKEAAKKLDEIERSVEEWGRGSISEVVLIPDLEKGGRFPLEIDRPLSNYVESARSQKQGRAAQSTEKSWDVEARVGTPTKNEDTTASNKGSANFPPSLIGTNFNAVVSEAEALKVGASHKMIEHALRFMAHPEGLPGNQKAFFAVAQVSVSPGWRTVQGYVAEVQVSFGYANTNSSASLTQNDAFPSVFAVFPFMEAQNFDLRTTYQMQANMMLDAAIQLAKVKELGQAEALIRNARKLQQEIATGTSLPLIVPSADHYSFTFRFDPESMALIDPTAHKPRGGQRLKPASFPALLVVICQEADLRNQANRYLAAHVETRWIRSELRSPIKQIALDYPFSGYAQQSVLKNKVRLRQAHLLDEIDSLLSLTRQHDFPLAPNTHLVEELGRRARNLRPIAMGRTIYTPLPEPAPIITAVEPGDLTRDDYRQKTNAISIKLSGFNFSTNSDVRLDGIPLQVHYSNTTTITFDIAMHQLQAWQLKHPPDVRTGLASIYLPLSVSTLGGLTERSNGLKILPTQFVLENRPPPVIEDVTESRLHIDEEKEVIIRGRNFIPPYPHFVQVEVAGHKFQGEVTTAQTIKCRVNPPAELEGQSAEISVLDDNFRFSKTNALTILTIPEIKVNETVPVDLRIGITNLVHLQVSNLGTNDHALLRILDMEFPASLSNDWLVAAVTLPDDKLLGTNSVSLLIRSGNRKGVVSNAFRIIPAPPLEILSLALPAEKLRAGQRAAVRLEVRNLRPELKTTVQLLGEEFEATPTNRWVYANLTLPANSEMKSSVKPNITLVNGSQASTLSNAFQMLPMAPTFETLTPPSIRLLETNTISLRGHFFVFAEKPALVIGNEIFENATSLSSTELLFTNILLKDPLAIGTPDLRLRADGETFSITRNLHVLPATVKIRSLSTNVIRTGESQPLIIAVDHLGRSAANFRLKISDYSESGRRSGDGDIYFDLKVPATLAGQSISPILMVDDIESIVPPEVNLTLAPPKERFYGFQPVQVRVGEKQNLIIDGECFADAVYTCVIFERPFQARRVNDKQLLITDFEIPVNSAPKVPVPKSISVRAKIGPQSSTTDRELEILPPILDAPQIVSLDKEQVFVSSGKNEIVASGRNFKVGGYVNVSAVFLGEHKINFDIIDEITLKLSLNGSEFKDESGSTLLLKINGFNSRASADKTIKILNRDEKK